MPGFGLQANSRALRILRPPIVRPATGHVLAVFITLVVFVIQRALVPWITLVPFILLFLAVFLSAWIGGRGPGLTSMALSVLLANYYFIGDAHGWSTSLRALVLCGLFVIVSTVMTLLCGSLRDAMQEAERTAALLRAVQDQMPAGLVVSDASGKLIASNDEMARIFRVPAMAPDGLDYSKWEGFHPDGRLYTLDEWPLARSLRHGDTVVGEEIEIVRGDGTRGIFSVNSAPVRDAGGRIIGGVIVRLDVTERKRTEKALQEAARQKDEFLAVLSHELRNPLTPICNSLFVLERATPEGEQAKRAREIITRQVAHLTRLVDDLLDMTRIAKGKMQLKRERTELVGLVRRTVDDHRATFKAANIELKTLFSDEPLWMSADSTRIAQVVGNILHNACKFTPPGGRVELEVTRQNSEGVIRVTDNGTGIEQKLLGRIFEPFTQADLTLDRSRGGLGLGLALVKGLVELHAGSIVATSGGTGRGSTFIVKLPLDTTPFDIVAASSVGESKAQSRRILIVEDNVDAAQSLLEALELVDHRVVVAHSGPEGIAKAREFKPEVILCDIGLPGMDGYELARTIRSDELLGKVFLVALTGYARPEDRVKSKAAGFDRHLAKPPSLEGLIRVISASA